MKLSAYGAEFAPEFLAEIRRTMDAFGRNGGFVRATPDQEQLTGRKPSPSSGSPAAKRG
jgi:hypothetical protein